MGKYIVTYAAPKGIPGDSTYYLRGTIWAYSRDRAQEFDSPEAARAALVAARRFMHAKVFKAAQVVEG